MVSVPAKVFLRADGGLESGMGHMMRMRALSYMLRGSFSCVFVSKNALEELGILPPVDVSSLIIESEEDWLMLPTAGDIVVFDGYHFDSSIFQRIRSLGALTVFLDDFLDVPKDADLLINHAPTSRFPSFKWLHTRILKGLNYAILQPEFLSPCHKTKKKDSLVICFGGSDYHGYSHSLLPWIDEWKTWSSITVIVGNQYRFLQELEETVAGCIQREKIIIQQGLESYQMHEQFCAADFALVPASNVALEAIASGCRLICGYYVDNQREIYESFKVQQLIIPCGDFSFAELRDAILKAGNTSSKAPVIDGLSPERIRKAFRQLAAIHQFAFLDMTKEDAEWTFNWANDPDARKFSFSTKSITWAEHLSWFKAKLEDEKVHFWKAEVENEQIGIVRFEPTTEGLRISYQVAPHKKGGGVGVSLLSGALYHLQTQFPENQRVYGDVMKENTASIHIFETLGFEAVDMGQFFRFHKEVV